MAEGMVSVGPLTNALDKADASISSSHDCDEQHFHNRAFSQDGSLLLEGEGDDGDDVFSNPDTAELESSRSDATGTTSPAPNSPGPSSPSNRGASHIAIVTSQYPSDAFNSIKQQSSEYSTSQTQKHSSGPLTLATLPSVNISQVQRQFEQEMNVETPKATTSTGSATATSILRPQFGRTLSASGTTALQSSPMLSGQGSRGTTPRLGSHSTSHSTSYLNLSIAQGQHPLPSAHDMPSDPKEASTISKLFARQPAQSPSEELSNFSLGSPRDSFANPQGMFRSATGSQLNSPSSQVMESSPLGGSRKFRSRPTTRPPSPERISSQNKSINAGLGLGVIPRVLSSDVDIIASSEPSIFERDIEHRDVGHVLSKSEAIDVAIPSVLDDAIEAITGDDANDFEIVAPHASSAPLALSSQALSAHASHNSSRQTVIPISSNSSPANPPSPPLSSSAAGGGAVEAPPGSMAAQIAERLASRGAIFEDQISPSARHRRPNSDVSLSSNSSMRSRSPQVPLSVGVQQVLDANASPVSPSTTIAKTSSSSPTTLGNVNINNRRSSTAANGIGATSTSASYANLMRLASHPSTPKPASTLPTATALPSLPLPNPFRTNSPSKTFTPLPDGGMPMTSSVSMDGAIMTTSESATMDASLAGLADVIATGSSRHINNANSPSAKLNAISMEEDVTPYSSRSPSGAQNASPGPLKGSNDRSMPGGLSLNLPDEDATTSAAIRLAKSSATSSTLTKKRLSFFSYADIINQTPAEVIDLDTAVRQTDEAVHSIPPASMNRSVSIERRGSTK